MRFFTPDILIRANSPDEAISDGADADWEAAISAYEARLADLGDRLPPEVRELADLNLHDGELLTWGDRHGASRPGRRLASHAARSDGSVVVVRLDQVATSIRYGLSGPVRASARRKQVPFTARDHVDWLYDEVDVGPAGKGTYLHRVMLGDGREIEVPFSSVVVQRFPLSPPSSDRIAPAQSPARRIA